MREKIFEEYSVPKAIFTLATPTILGMLITVAYNMADTYFIGQTGDANKVAAVSLCLPVFIFFMAIGNLFGTGGGTYISRLLGLKKYEKVRNVSSFCLYGSLISGVICVGLTLVFIKPILVLCGASANTYLFAKDYLFWIGLGAPIIIVQHSLGQIIRAEGASKFAMMGMVTGTVLNIILDPLMITVLGWGCGGAAIATVIGNSSTIIYYLWYLKNKETVLSLSLSDFRSDRETVAPVFKIGIPTSINSMLFSAANIFLNNYAASYGDKYVAAVGVSHRIAQVPRLLIIGLSQGTQPFIGYNYAAKKIKRMNDAIKYSGLFGMIFGAIAFLTIFLSAGTFVKFFINDAEVIQIGTIFTKISILTLPVVVFLFLFMHSLQAFGKAIPSFILVILRDGVAFIPAIMIFNNLMGVNGIVLAQPFADFLAIIAGALLYWAVVSRMKKQSSAHDLHAK